MYNLHYAPVHPGRSWGPQINDRSRRREKRSQQCEYAERVHQEGRNLDALNHQQRRYLGRRYSDQYPQWARRSPFHPSDERHGYVAFTRPLPL